MTTEELARIESAARGEGRKDQVADPADTLALCAKVRELLMTLEGERKGRELLQAGMESQADVGDSLKQTARKQEKIIKKALSLITPTMSGVLGEIRTILSGALNDGN